MSLAYPPSTPSDWELIKSLQAVSWNHEYENQRSPLMRELKYGIMVADRIGLITVFCEDPAEAELEPTYRLYWNIPNAQVASYLLEGIPYGIYTCQLLAAGFERI